MEVRFTRRDYDLLPEDMRVELIDGQLLKTASPSVNHQILLQEIQLALIACVGRRRLLPGPMDFAIDDENVLVPDLVVFREGEAPHRDARDIGSALVVVEVLSPSTESRDREIQPELYHTNGVDEVWLIDGVRRRVETFGGWGWSIFDSGATLTSRVLPEFDLSLEALFGEPPDQPRS